MDIARWNKRPAAPSCVCNFVCKKHTKTRIFLYAAHEMQYYFTYLLTLCCCAGPEKEAGAGEGKNEWIEIVHGTALEASFWLRSSYYLPSSSSFFCCCRTPMDIHEGIAGKFLQTMRELHWNTDVAAGHKTNCILLIGVMQKIKKNYQQSTRRTVSKEWHRTIDGVFYYLRGKERAINWYLNHR